LTMAGLKLLPMLEFHRALRASGLTVKELAEEAGVGRAHLILVFNAQREGERTWAKVVPFLEEKHVRHLKLCPAWNIHASEAWEAELALRAREALTRRSVA
jgi:hypothetical protein